jgi:hypothetical protein
MNLHHLSEYRGYSPEKLRKHGVFSTPRFFLDVYCLKPGQAQATAVHCPAGSDHGVHNPGPGDARVLVFMTPNPSKP